MRPPPSAARLTADAIAAAALDALPQFSEGTLPVNDKALVVFTLEGL
jgi:hypothetical protein